MQINISTQFVFDVPLTEKHVLALIKLSKLHYDGRCRLASSESPHGFLTLWRRMIEAEIAADLNVSPTRASFAELDTCLKLLEAISVIRVSNQELSALCDEMTTAFHGAINLANSKYSEWQAVYAPEVV